MQISVNVYFCKHYNKTYVSLLFPSDVDNVNGYRVKLATTPLSSDLQTSCRPNSSPSAEEFHVLVKTGNKLKFFKTRSEYYYK